MSYRSFAKLGVWGAGIVLVFGVCLVLLPAAGYAKKTESDESSSLRTPWGDPAIGGIWNSSTVTPVERPNG